MDALARPRVGYRADKVHRIQIGFPAIIVREDKPEDVHSITTLVQSVDGLTGEFWTNNTYYYPVYESKKEKAPCG